MQILWNKANAYCLQLLSSLQQYDERCHHTMECNLYVMSVLMISKQNIFLSYFSGTVK